MLRASLDRARWLPALLRAHARRAGAAAAREAASAVAAEGGGAFAVLDAYAAAEAQHAALYGGGPDGDGPAGRTGGTGGKGGQGGKGGASGTLARRASYGTAEDAARDAADADEAGAERAARAAAREAAVSERAIERMMAGLLVLHRRLYALGADAGFWAAHVPLDDDAFRALHALLSDLGVPPPPPASALPARVNFCAHTFFSDRTRCIATATARVLIPAVCSAIS